MGLVSVGVEDVLLARPPSKTANPYTACCIPKLLCKAVAHVFHLVLRSFRGCIQNVQDSLHFEEVTQHVLPQHNESVCSLHDHLRECQPGPNGTRQELIDVSIGGAPDADPAVDH